MNTDPRIQELLDLAEAEQFTLALPPAIIVKMEDAGAVVNLRTGAIVIDGEQVRYAPAQAAQAAQAGYSVVMTDNGGAYVLDKATRAAYAIVQTDKSGRAKWRKQRMRVLVRDNFTCQAQGCGCKDLDRLTVHHIVPKVEGGSDDLPNLVTFCAYHHEQAHRTAGQVAS